MQTKTRSDWANNQSGRIHDAEHHQEYASPSINSIHNAHSRYSAGLSAADFMAGMVPVAESVGIIADSSLIVDGEWHNAEALEPKSRGRVRYCAQWRISRKGLRHLLVVFYSARRGGMTAIYDGFSDALAMYRTGRAPQPAPLPKRLPPKPKISPGKAFNLMNMALRGSVLLNQSAAGLGLRYVLARGLDAEQDLTFWREHPGMLHRESRAKYSALLAPVVNIDGGLRGVHQTFLARGGSGKAAVDPDKKMMPVPHEGATAGCAIRIDKAGPVLAVCEGIETALAVRQLTGLPVWATRCASGMAGLIVPNAVRELRIYGDYDAHGAGEKAAEKLATRMIAESRNATVHIPPKAGTDWLDFLNAGGEF